MKKIRNLVAAFALLFILSFLLVPTAFAGDCGATAAPGVDWSGCDFSSPPLEVVGPAVSLAGADLSNAILTDATLFNLDMSGASLAGTDLTGASMVGLDLTGADISGMNMALALVAVVDFTGAIGVPLNVDQAFFYDYITCPNGDEIPPTESCTWVPTAVHLSSIDGQAQTAVWPGAMFMALLLGSTAVYLFSRQRIVGKAVAA